MYLVSKIKTATIFIFALVLLSSGFILVTPTKAEAVSPAPFQHQYFQSYVATPNLPTTSYQQEFPATTYQSINVRPSGPWDFIACAATGVATMGTTVIIGAATNTGPCGEAVSSVKEFVGGAIDCITSALECVTEWIFEMLGGAVAWVGRGIVTLVAGVNSECIPPSGTSATFDDSHNNSKTLSRRAGEFQAQSTFGSIDAACSERIAMDYFSQTDENITNFYNAIDQASQTGAAPLLRELNQLVANGQGDSERANELRQEIAAAGGSEQDAESMNRAIEAINQQNSNWYTPKATVSTDTFKREYGKYVLISLALMVPFIIAAAVQGVVTGKAGLMLRGVFVHMPLAVFGMLVTPYLVKLLMAIVDSFSAFILGDVGNDIEGFFSNGHRMFAVMTLGAGKFILIPAVIITLAFLIAAMFVWFILNVREASISLVAVFLPIALAASIWPVLASWAIKAIKLLVASIISKIFIVGALSLGLGIFTGSTDNGGGMPSFSHLLYGTVIFFIAAFSPALVFRFMDEIGDSLTNEGKTGSWTKTIGAATAVQSLTGQGPLQALTGKLGGGGGGGGFGGGGASVASKAGMKGLDVAKNAVAGGASKQDAAKQGAQAAAQYAKSGGGGAQEQGAAASGAWSSAGGSGGSVGAGAMGGSSAADAARESGASASEAAEAGGLGAAGGGLNPVQAGQVAYAEAIHGGLSEGDARAVQSKVTKDLQKANAPGGIKKILSSPFKAPKKGWGLGGGAVGVGMHLKNRNKTT